MPTSSVMTSLVDRLQAEIDRYVAEHQDLLVLYHRALMENETLRDKIAELMDQKNDRQV